MTPQDRFVIVAQVKCGHDSDLRSALAKMTYTEYRGVVKPDNELVRFRRFDTIHFARFVVLADDTLEDWEVYKSSPPPKALTYLCFMVDCDGYATDLLVKIARACPKLSEVFEHCVGFAEAPDLLEWMRAHRVRPQTSYVNWAGRTVKQIKQEAKLHGVLRSALPLCTARDPQSLLAELRAAVDDDATIELCPPSPTPLSWRLRNIAHFLAPLAIAGLFLLLFPLLTLAIVAIGLAMFLVVLRRHEQTDPIIEQRLDADKIEHLRQAEDYDVTNQYTAMGSIKPGPFRLGLTMAALYALNWAARHICTRGRIGRISTIHFAHWVLLKGGQRAFFCSYYDGGHEPYMDDFINKAGFGLNFSFSSFVGYPGTDWLFGKGAWREQEFKRVQRRHQIPPDVWYNAYPGLTAHDLARNSRIRNGFEKQSMSDDEIRRWLAEI
jgi:hypothetical protein